MLDPYVEKGPRQQGSQAVQSKTARDLILVQHQYNNCTTIPYMRVGPSMWDPPSCERLLYSYCIGVINLTFFKRHSNTGP
jgi:hypothetical protein